jgi:hypothetical protein
MKKITETLTIPPMKEVRKLQNHLSINPFLIEDCPMVPKSAPQISLKFLIIYFY